MTVKITTDDGVTGLGDATLNGRELAVAAYLNEHVCPLLIDRGAGNINDIRQYADARSGVVEATLARSTTR